MGLRDSETRQLLLAEENLTITQAVAKAFTRERASLEATDVARLTVHKVTTGKVCKKTKKDKETLETLQPKDMLTEETSDKESCRCR